MERAMKHLSLLAVGVMLGLVIVLLGWQFLGQTYTFHGSVIDPPVAAPELALTDHNGQPYRLSEQEGKVVLIFFGYTNCPDVCPLTLSEYKQIKNDLGDSAENVEFVFISVDPERDTVERLREYVPLFDPAFIGLTGERAELEPVWKDYGVYQARQETDSAAGYLVDHSSRIYVIDKNGNWRETFSFGMDTDLMAQDVDALLRENSRRSE